MGLFSTDSELQVTVCNHGEPHTQVPLRNGEESSFIEGKEVWGEACIVNRESMAFHRVSSDCHRLALAREEVFLLHVGLIRGHESSPFWSLDST